MIYKQLLGVQRVQETLIGVIVLQGFFLNT